MDGLSAAALFDGPHLLNSNGIGDQGNDWSPRLTTDGEGIWLATWYSQDPLNGLGSDSDILFSRSLDGGASWSPAEPLNSNAHIDRGSDTRASVVTDGAGAWVAVWRSSEDFGGLLGTDGDILVARSSDGAVTWSPWAMLNSYAPGAGGEDNDPWLATDGDGTWVAIWTSHDSLGDTVGTDSDVFVSRSTDGGLNWSDSGPLNSTAATDDEFGWDYRGRLAADGLGNWIVVWESSNDLGGSLTPINHVLFSRSTDGGVTWSDPAAVKQDAGTDMAGELFPQIASDGEGNCVVLWTRYSDSTSGYGRDPDLFTSHTSDGGLTWSSPSPIMADATTDDRTEQYAQIATDGHGTWMAVWSVPRNPDDTPEEDSDVFQAISLDFGASWSEPEPLNQNALWDLGLDIEPTVASDGNGNWVGAWMSSNTASDELGPDWDIHFARATFIPVSLDGLTTH